ncbi:MAG: EAL domain-containing protein [Vallitaleaceae bacterium]|nr:EAL domain-containing protein [Vallitaleaceae bacterium]
MFEKFNKSLRVRITFLSFVSIIVIQLIFIFGTYTIYGRYVIKNSLDTLSITTNETAIFLERIIASYMKPLNNISNIPHLNTMDWEEQQVLIDTNYNGFYDEIAMVDIDGQAKYYDGTVLDLSDRKYIKKALMGQSAISEMLISRKTGESVIVAAVPIFDPHDETVGAILGRIEMVSLFEDIKTTGYMQSPQRFIVSSGGSVIYSEVGDHWFKDNNFEDELRDFVHIESQNDNGVKIKKYEGENYYVLYSQIGDYQWGLYNVISEYSILKPVRNLSYLSLICSLIFSLFIMLFTYMVIRKASKPIHELDQLMLRGSEGDFSVRAKFNRQDEIGRLGNSFNVLMDRIKSLTYFDVETSLPNAIVFEEDYHVLISTEKSKDKLGLVMIEVDELINTRNKRFDIHATIVENVVKRLKRFVPANSVLYKYTDNAFAILIPDTTNMITQVFEDKISGFLNDFEEKKSIDNHFIVNIGYSFIRDNPSYIDLINAAIAATKYAKKDHHSSIKRFTEAMLDELNYDAEMKLFIANALTEKQFYLLYQPIVALGSQKVVKTEALIRWSHPDKGQIMPDEFIPIAETTALIIDIDYFVIEEACQLLKSRQLANLRLFPISINITAKTLEQVDFVSKLESILRKYQVNPSHIEIEITERVVMSNFNVNIETLLNLRKIGIKISLDDFGIGYSSLSYLSKIPLDYVKIDKSFIEAITDNKMAEQVIKSMIQMCDNMSLSVVAEGIETTEEAMFLLENMCLYGQGYLFSKPLSIEDLKFEYDVL